MPLALTWRMPSLMKTSSKPKLIALSLLVGLTEMELFEDWLASAVEESKVIFSSEMGFQELFLKLIGVKGLGCKMALPMLATGSIQGIIDAIERENILYLKKFPKIGDKVARQIILDLKGKLAPSQEISEPVNDELALALKSLGYKASDINKVVKNVDLSLDLEDQIKEALKLLLK